MYPTPAQMLRDYKKASAAIRKEYNTPAKAMKFLIKAGLFERHAGSPGGVRPTRFLPRLTPASTTFVLAYHGCSAAVAEKVFGGKLTLAASDNDYDWLGPGIYFWEHNSRRAFDFAREVRDQPRNVKQRIADPAVVGAVIDLGYCLNLYDGEAGPRTSRSRRNSLRDTPANFSGHPASKLLTARSVRDPFALAGVS